MPKFQPIIHMGLPVFKIKRNQIIESDDKKRQIIYLDLSSVDTVIDRISDDKKRQIIYPDLPSVDIVIGRISELNIDVLTIIAGFLSYKCRMRVAMTNKSLYDVMTNPHILNTDIVASLKNGPVHIHRQPRKKHKNRNRRKIYQIINANDEIYNDYLDGWGQESDVEYDEIPNEINEYPVDIIPMDSCHENYHWMSLMCKNQEQKCTKN
jgi:hypothetical protein